MRTITQHDRTMFRKHPLGCKDLSDEWLNLWDALAVVLNMTAYVDTRVCGKWKRCIYASATVGHFLRFCVVAKNEDAVNGFRQRRRRVVLENGLVIKDYR